MERDVPDAERCPYCGALSSSADEPNDAAALEVLRFMAALYDIEPLYPNLVLLRVRYPLASNRELAGRLGITPTACYRLWQRLKAYSPVLARFARGDGTKTRGKDGGRKPWKGQA